MFTGIWSIICVRHLPGTALLCCPFGHMVLTDRRDGLDQGERRAFLPGVPRG